MRRICFAVIMAVLILVMSSCAGPDSNLNEPETTDSKVHDTTNDSEEVIEFFKYDGETFVIENSYVDLQYPTKWKDCVSVTLSEDDNGCYVEFTALLDETDISLYTIAIGNENNGYLLGTVNTDLGEKNVYLIDQYDEAVDILSEESLTKYYEMCEDVNVIISKLVYDNGMIMS